MAELYQAASQLKRRRVMRLLDDLPEEHEAIAQHLSTLADAYQFDQIAELFTVIISSSHGNRQRQSPRRLYTSGGGVQAAVV